MNYNEPRTVGKWVGSSGKVFRLVCTGVNFEMQEGDDTEGYEVCENQFHVLASMLMLEGTEMIKKVDNLAQFEKKVDAVGISTVEEIATTT